MIRCPKCGATECRESRWRSEDERRRHPGERPFRCHACLHLFFSRGGRRRLRDNPVVAAVGGSTLVMVLAVIVIMWFWSNRDRGTQAVAPSVVEAPVTTGVGPAAGTDD